MTSSPGEGRLEVLLIACFDGQNAQTITDHVEALERYSRHRVLVYNHYPALANGLRYLPSTLRLSRFDVVVIHYSMYLLDEAIDYFDQRAKAEIATFAGLKVVFRQDEYNHVDGLMTVLRKLRADVLFTNFPPEEAPRVYRADQLPGLRLVSNLTGYVSENFRARTGQPLAGRPIDVGYRSRKLPYWLGALGAEKMIIAQEFQRRTQGLGLKTDISVRESDRIYGERWPQFLADCKAVLGTESGASVIDFTGEVRSRCDQYVKDHPGASFEEVQSLFFQDLEGRYHLEQISPRCFETACLGTAMILFEGRYSGILEPWRHYVPLKKDFSNLDEVVAALRDLDRLQAMVDRTHNEVALNPKYSYQHFVDGFDRALDEEFARKGVPAVDNPYTREVFERATGSHLGARAGLAPIQPISITSRLLTEPGHELGNALTGTNSDGIVVAQVGQPLPHEFTLALPRTFSLHRIVFIWLSLAERALDIDIDLLMGSSIVKTLSVRDNASVQTSVEIPWVPCRKLRVRVSRFAGEQRLKLSSVEVYGSWRPFGSSPLRPLLRSAWLMLPLGIRGRSRHLLDRAASAFERTIWSLGSGFLGRSLAHGPGPVQMSLRSSLRFYSKHELANALDGDPSTTYVAAIEGQPLPHEFLIVLSRAIRAGRFTILWESAENCARRFTITAYCRSEERARIEVEENDRQEFAADLDDVQCDRIRISIKTYHGQQRLLLRRVALTEASPPSTASSTPADGRSPAAAAVSNERVSVGAAHQARP